MSLVDAWSSNGSKYKGTREIAAKWRSFKRTGITGGTLAEIARNHGADLSAIALKYRGNVNAYDMAEAAEAAAEALAAGKPAQALGYYRKRIGYIHAELDKANKLRHFQFSRAFTGVFKEKLATSQNMRAAFFELLAGETTYGEIEKRISKKLLGKITGTMTGWPARLAGKLRG